MILAEQMHVAQMLDLNDQCSHLSGYRVGGFSNEMPMEWADSFSTLATFIGNRCDICLQIGGVVCCVAYY